MVLFGGDLRGSGRQCVHRCGSGVFGRRVGIFISWNRNLFHCVPRILDSRILPGSVRDEETGSQTVLAPRHDPLVLLDEYWRYSSGIPTQKIFFSQFCVGERDRPLPRVVLPCGEPVLFNVLAQGSRSGTFWLFRLLLPNSGLVASSAILHHGRNQGRTDLWSGRCEWLLPSCRRYRFLCCPMARSLGGLWTGSSRNGNRISPGQFATRITGCSIGKYPR